MKNKICAALLFAALIPAAAQAAEGRYHDDTRMTALSGFYVGGLAGMGWTDVDTGPATLDVDGGDYGVFAGYQLDTRPDSNSVMGFNGAIEAHYAWSDADDSGLGATAEKDHEWGVSLRPGLSFMDDYAPLGVKPYAILGYRRASFEGTAPGVAADEDFDGFELGLGTEFIAYQDFGVRLDYAHVFYGEESGLDPDEDDLRLGVAYHF